MKRKERGERERERGKEGRERERGRGREGKGEEKSVILLATTEDIPLSSVHLIPTSQPTLARVGEQYGHSGDISTAITSWQPLHKRRLGECRLRNA